MDRLCAQAEMLSGKDMLEMAKNYHLNEQAAGKKRRGIRKISGGILIAAACVSALGLTAVTAGAAGYGPLSALFRNTFHDKTTADLVDSGYLYEIHQPLADGIYRAELIAVSGDTSNPMLVIDLYIDDPEIAAANKTLTIGVYTLGVEQYENELDHYGTADGTAYRDEQIPNLYHASVRGAPVWIVSGRECVIDIAEIHRVDADGTPVIDHTHMETRMTFPLEGFFVGYSDYFDDFNGNILTGDGVEFRLRYLDFGAYESVVAINYDAPENHDDFLLSSLVLNVDGTEYHADPEKSGSWYNDGSEDGSAPIYYIYPTFPAVDVNAAEKITLSLGSDTLILKDGSVPSGSEILQEYGNLRENVYYNNPYKPVLLHARNTEYQLTGVAYYDSFTRLCFGFDAEQIDSQEISRQLVLNVNGTDYRCNPLQITGWCDTEGELGYPNRNYVYPIFPAIDYESAENITVSFGEDSVDLKDPALAESEIGEEGISDTAYYTQFFTDSENPVILSDGTTDYQLYSFTCYHNSTEICLSADVEEVDTDTLKSSLILSADGEEFKCMLPFNDGTVWRDENGDAGPANRWYIYCTLPPIDYLYAEDVSVRIGDTSYALKSADEAEDMESDAE